MANTQRRNSRPQDASTYDRLIALLDRHNAQYRLIDHPTVIAILPTRNQ